MNAVSQQLDGEAVSFAREETWAALGSVAHYADLARGHLEVADDAAALYDIVAARERFLAALAAFGPIRSAMKARKSEPLPVVEKEVV